MGDTKFHTYQVFIMVGIAILILYKLWESVQFSEIVRESFTTYVQPRYQKAFVINLPGTPEGERSWQNMQRMTQYHNITRFPGIYGKQYDYSAEVKNGIVVESWDYGAWKGGASKLIPMEKSEIGISLSYYYLFTKIATENIPVSLILEDDATNVHPQFESKLAEYMDLLPPDWDIFLLGFWLHRGDNGYPVLRQKIHRVRDFCLLHAFMITAKGARKLLAHLPIDRPVDSWISKCAHDNVIIYRHDMVSNPASKKPSSILVKQARLRQAKQIKNTNNW
jgi:hypothetical protein